MKRILSLLSLLFLFICCLYSQTFQDEVIRRAESGDLGSQKFLARAFFEGKGIYSKNVQESYKWIKLAAEQKDPEALFVLYNYHKNGIGCEKQLDFDSLFDSANQQYPPAMLELGIILSQLYGKEETGLQYLLEAYKLGEVTALPMIGANYAYSGDYVTAKYYYEKATKECEGYDKANAFRGLAYLYGDGIGVDKNIKEAHNLIDKAIEIISDNPEFYDFKGELYLQEGKMKEASLMWNKVIDSSLTYALETKSELALAMNHSIDYGIPKNNNTNNKTLALIIANENYKRVPNVPYAINDGAVFKKYLISTFGVPEENIEYLEDASLNDIKYALSNVSQRCDAFKDQMSVIVYYAGHGVPDDKTNEAYLLPVDGFGTDPKSGLNMEDFYESLSEMPAKSVIVLLDACFSGAKRDGGMLMATRGITIKPNMKVPDGKLIVLSATAEDQTAFPVEDQKHGLFTYTLLRKIQETNGDITWGELADYVTETVKTRSIDLAGKLQSPTVSVSPSIKDSWHNQKIR